VITFDEVMKQADAFFKADFPPTKFPTVDADRREAYLLGFARGGAMTATAIASGTRAIVETNKNLQKISEESK